MQAGVSVSDTRRSGAGHSPLDQTWFPHILSRVVELAPLDALLGLRSTCRRLRDSIDERLFEHVVLVTVAPRSAGAKTGCSPTHTPNRRGTDTKSNSCGFEQAFNGPHPDPRLGHRQCLRLAVLIPPLVRRCNPSAAGLPAHIIVQTLSLSPTDDDDGVFRAWDRFRQLAVTVTGMTPIGAPGARAAGGGGTFVAHLTYNGPPRRGIVFNIRSKLRELVVVLPSVPDDAEVGEVVEGMRVTLMMALPSVGGGTRITLVGVDRFGGRHFGFPDAEDELEAVRRALLAHCRLEADDERLVCLTYEEWASDVSPEISARPPHIPNTVIGETESTA